MGNTIITKEGYVLEMEDEHEVIHQKEQENTTEYIVTSNNDDKK